MYPHIHHQPNQPILDVQHIHVRYNGYVALENITFHLHEGERVAVVGPNGAGKSTLFKVVSGVLQPGSGEVNIFGSRPRGHVCIAYIPQRSQVDWNFPVSVADVVMMGRSAKLGPLNWPHKSDWEHVRRAPAPLARFTQRGAGLVGNWGRHRHKAELDDAQMVC